MSRTMRETKNIKFANLRGGIAKELVTKLLPESIQCKSKKPVTFNGALDISSKMWEDYGDFLSVSTSAYLASK